MRLTILSLLFVTACASVPRADIPRTANSADEIARLDRDLQMARSAQWDILAAKDLRESEKHLDQARTLRSRDTNTQPVLEQLRVARGYYDRAHESVQMRAPKVADVLAARTSAIAAGAHDFPKANREIAKVDERFRAQAKSLDDGRNDDLWSRMRDAYRDAEITAVQEQHLGRARALISEARANGATLYARVTLREAENAVADAEAAIAEHPRQEREYIDSVLLANRAARYLTAVNATSRDTAKRSDEQVAREIVNKNNVMTRVRAELAGAELEAQARERALKSARAQLGQAKNNLRSEREWNQALDEVRQKFARDEADVYRDGDKLLIRLKTLGFGVGKAQVPASSKPLLAKVKGVIEDLHAKDVVVQGHTDATGTPKVNERVSEARAETVKDYLKGAAGEVEAVGLGDKRPIRSNKTPDGRKANRRVDVVITPATLAR